MIMKKNALETFRRQNRCRGFNDDRHFVATVVKIPLKSRRSCGEFAV